MSYILYFDTSDNTKTIIRLEDEKGIVVDEKEIENTNRHSQVLLPAIETILKKYKLDLDDLSEIKVNRGPGSFTGLRVGIAIANSLNWALKLKKIDQLDEPGYAPFVLKN